jgi:6-pyruvoyltetrahydropterin/6-carboxytetrahydropterin synthase
VKLVYLTRLYRFNAGHRLFHPERDEGWNERVFGKCSTPGGHGHNYALEVTVRGAPDPESGQVCPPGELDRRIEEQVLGPLDHKNLNLVLELRDGPAPTTEVLILELWRRLASRVPPPAALHRLRIVETEKNAVELESR